MYAVGWRRSLICVSSAAGLLSFYGQHEHRRLMLTAAQLDALDGSAAVGRLSGRTEMAAAHERVRGLEARFEELDGRVGARERELDLIGFELREIAEIDPSVGGGGAVAGRTRPAAQRGGAAARSRGRCRGADARRG